MSVGIGLLGCGTVGGGVAALLLRDAAAIARSGSAGFALRAVAVRDVHKLRSAPIDPAIVTSDAGAVVDDPANTLIVECIGGTSVAGELVERALRVGKHVVTANKDLVATRGPSLAALAAAAGVTFHYEAAVGGAIPIVRALADSLAGESVYDVGGILNGTTNFILSEMARGATYARALDEAQRLGYAEADPTSDVGGIDAAHKLAILMQLAFKRAVTSPLIARRGITAISRDDVSLANRMRWAVKLVAAARSADRLEAGVLPAYVPFGHPFAEPAGANNCIRVIGRASGSLTFAGSGAGRDPTASAVIGDVIAALRRIAGVPGESPELAPVIESAIAPLRTPHVVRMRSLRDARPAAAALTDAGYHAEASTEMPIVTLAPVAFDALAAIERALTDRGLAPESIIALWDDGVGHART